MTVDPLFAETAAWEPSDQRFELVRRGYDTVAVDEYLDQLERELSELRIRRAPSGAVSAELERLGEQTSSILLAAHESAQRITREAEERADRCLQDAAANALKMTEDAQRQLRELDAETDSVWQERARLIEDARTVATALFNLTEEAIERFPADKPATGAAVIAVQSEDQAGPESAAEETGSK